MLGRALPLRDSKTGEILKWFGTCTDIQDIVDARETGRRMHQQLLDVLYYSQMNMWVVDNEGRLTFSRDMRSRASHQMKYESRCLA